MRIKDVPWVVIILPVCGIFWLIWQVCDLLDVFDRRELDDFCETVFDEADLYD